MQQAVSNTKRTNSLLQVTNNSLVLLILSAKYIKRRGMRSCDRLRVCDLPRSVQGKFKFMSFFRPFLLTLSNRIELFQFFWIITLFKTGHMTEYRLIGLCNFDMKCFSQKCFVYLCSMIISKIEQIFQVQMPPQNAWRHKGGMKQVSRLRT